MVTYPALRVIAGSGVIAVDDTTLFRFGPLREPLGNLVTFVLVRSVSLVLRISHMPRLLLLLR